MKKIQMAWAGIAVVLAIIFTCNHSHAQMAQTAIAPPPSVGGYAVTEHGANYRVWQKTTVEHGTNHVHRYVELATGMYYTNASGQLTESSEQITLLPQGGAAATQGRHQVYFPADIYNGVLEVVTPDGRHLKSRPLGVSYDDGTNTAFIATLKHSVGYLTSTNQVTYPDAFTGFKADLVCTYRRSGFESDLVFRQQPPTPDQVGLNNSSSTLQMVTEFFNTADPEEIAGHPDKRSGLQDTTLKFGGMTMTHGKAFAIQTTNAVTIKSRTTVYKKWVHIQGRTFLIEQVPLTAIARDLDALPLTASLQKTSGKGLFASQHPQFPPAHGTLADNQRILLASADFNQKPGVVLDYDEVDSGYADFTFAADTTYYIGNVEVDGTLTFEAGTVLKFNEDGSSEVNFYGPEICNTTADHPAVFTSINDDSVGEALPFSSGTPAVGESQYMFTWDYYYPDDIVFEHCRFLYAGEAAEIYAGGIFNDVQFIQCEWGVSQDSFDPPLIINNSLGNGCYLVADGNLICNNDTFDQCVGAGDADTYFTNCIFSNDTNAIAPMYGDYFAPPTGDHNGFYNTPEFGYNALTNTAYPFQTVGGGNYYLADNTFRHAGMTNIDTNVLAEIQTRTTYPPSNLPSDFSATTTLYPCVLRDTTPVHDLGYHYYPIDYQGDSLTVESGATLTLTNGVTVSVAGNNVTVSGTLIADQTLTNAEVQEAQSSPSTVLIGGNEAAAYTDTDGDGLPDWWEYKYFGNLEQSGSDLDANGDTLLYDYTNNIAPYLTRTPVLLATISATDPVDIKWVAPSNLYVLSGSTATLTEFDTNGNAIRALSGLGLNPSGFDVDAAGNVYVALTSSNQVWKFNPSNTTFTADMTFGYGGYIGNGDGSSGTNAGEFDAPFDVAVSADGGTLSVSDSGNNDIQQFDSSGNFITAFGSSGSSIGQFDAPKGLTYDSVGNLYIADSGNSRIMLANDATVLNASGAFGTSFGQFNSPANVSVNDRGIYVADTGNNRIQCFNPLANGVYSFDLSDFRFAFSTNFSGPFSVAAVDNLTNEMFYVADTGNNRVLLYDFAAEDPTPAWTNLTAHVAVGDISGAISNFSGVSTNEYQQAFISIGTNDLSSAISQIGTLTPVFIKNASAEYYFTNTIDGQTITFPVEFDKENGVWKILEF